ncbi:hypothetical protein GCM10020256_44980 [Streptomyces thermocoprophilus]
MSKASSPTSCAPAGSSTSSTSATAAGAWSCVSPSTNGTASTPSPPGAQLDLDPELLARFPEGYRHLAYLQSRLGYPVKTDMPGITGSRTDALYALGRDWLAGTVDTLDHWT